LELLANAPAVHGLDVQELEDQHVGGAADDVGGAGGHCGRLRAGVVPLTKRVYGHRRRSARWRRPPNCRRASPSHWPTRALARHAIDRGPANTAPEVASRPLRRGAPGCIDNREVTTRLSICRNRRCPATRPACCTARST